MFGVSHVVTAFGGHHIFRMFWCFSGELVLLACLGNSAGAGPSTGQELEAISMLDPGLTQRPGSVGVPEPPIKRTTADD